MACMLPFCILICNICFLQSLILKIPQPVLGGVPFNKPDIMGFYWEIDLYLRDSLSLPMISVTLPTAPASETVGKKIYPP